MNRRSFFKTVTGVIAGIFTLPSLAKEKPKLTVAMLQEANEKLRGSDTHLVLGDDFDEVDLFEPETYNWINKGCRVIVCTRNYAMKRTAIKAWNKRY